MEGRRFNKRRFARVFFGIVFVSMALIGIYFGSAPLGKKIVDIGKFDASDFVVWFFGLITIIFGVPIVFILGWGLYKLMKRIGMAFVDYICPQVEVLE